MSMSPYRMWPACLFLLFGCAGSPGEGEVQVRLAIGTVPGDVSCVRLTAAGNNRTVSRELDVVSGGSVNESFAGLPLGTVEFLAEAFGHGCQAVTRTTVPAWISDPAPTSIVIGRTATVALTLHRNGRAKLSVDFADEPLCSEGGVVCLGDSECCSRDCSGGVCRLQDGGVRD